MGTANKKEIRSSWLRSWLVSAQPPPFKRKHSPFNRGHQGQRGTVYRSALIGKLRPRRYTGDWSRGLRSALSVIKLVEHSATKCAVPWFIPISLIRSISEEASSMLASGSIEFLWLSFLRMIDTSSCFLVSEEYFASFTLNIAFCSNSKIWNWKYTRKFDHLSTYKWE